MHATPQAQEQSDIVQRAAVKEAAQDERAGSSPRVQQQKALSDAVHNSARMVAQRRKIDAISGAAPGARRSDLVPVESADGNVVQMLQVNSVGREDAHGGYDTDRTGEFAAWVETLKRDGVFLRNLSAELAGINAPDRNETLAKSVVALRMHSARPEPKANVYMSELPRDQWWKLFIDKGAQGPGTNAKNALKFDSQKSPGYYAAMSNSFQAHVASAVAGQRAPIDAGQYKAMHDQVALGTLKENDNANGYEPMPVAYSGRETSFGVLSSPQDSHTHDIQIPSLTGLREMAGERTLGFNVDHPVGQHNPGNASSLARVQYLGRRALADNAEANSKLHPLGDNFYAKVARDPDTAPVRIQAILDGYYAEIGGIHGGSQEARNKRKLGVIVKAVRALHVGHFFQDANGRLNTMTLLNKFLIEEGFTPVIMDDTGAFGGGFSVAQLIAQIVRGMRAFKESVESDNAHIHTTGIPEVNTDRRYGADGGPHFSIVENAAETLSYTVAYARLAGQAQDILAHYRARPDALGLAGDNTSGALTFADPKIAERLERQLEAQIL